MQVFEAGADLRIPGLGPFLTPNASFYRVDTAIVLPQIPPKSWQLRIHGMVSRELTLSFDDLLKFFAKLPNPDKQFTVMPGIAHASFQQKNYAICYHILANFFSQPAPIYRGH